MTETAHTDKFPDALEAEALAAKIIDRANDGYHRRDDYPPYALTPWEDRLRWSDYIKKVAAEVLSEVRHG